MDTAVFPKAAKGLDEEDLPAVLMLIALAAMACMLPAPADTFYHLRSGGERPAALAAVRSCPAPIYNGFYEGGALIWFVPEQRVFMDGRVDVYQQDFLLRGRRADLEGDYKSLFADYGIRCAVVSSRSPIAQALRADASMRLRFADDAWAVFVRDAHF